MGSRSGVSSEKVTSTLLLGPVVPVGCWVIDSEEFTGLPLPTPGTHVKAIRQMDVYAHGNSDLSYW